MGAQIHRSVGLDGWRPIHVDQHRVHADHLSGEGIVGQSLEYDAHSVARRHAHQICLLHPELHLGHSEVGQCDNGFGTHRRAGPRFDGCHGPGCRRHEYRIFELAPGALQVQARLGDVQLGRVEVLGRRPAQHSIQLGLGLFDLGLCSHDLVWVGIFPQRVQLSTRQSYLSACVGDLVVRGSLKSLCVLGLGLLVVGGRLP